MMDVYEFSECCKIFFSQLVSNAILFLASVCERPHYKDLFKEEGTLQSICQKVIVPNMEFRGSSLQPTFSFKFWIDHEIKFLAYRQRSKDNFKEKKKSIPFRRFPIISENVQNIILKCLEILKINFHRKLFMPPLLTLFCFVI